MNILVVLANPKENSFSHAMAESVKQTITIFDQTHTIAYDCYDLYQMNWNPVLHQNQIQRRFPLQSSVQQACQKLNQADLLIFIHPLWWGSMPAILKGFIEQTFITQVAFSYEKDPWGQIDKLSYWQGKQALICMSADTPYPLESIQKQWKNDILGYCGIDQVDFHVIRPLVQSTYEQRHQYLQQLSTQVEKYLQSFFSFTNKPV